MDGIKSQRHEKEDTCQEVEGSTIRAKGYERPTELLDKIVEELKRHYGHLGGYKDKNLAQPGNPSVLGVSVSPGGYMLSYGSSPCGYVVTEQLAFSGIAPLISYIPLLHVLPAAIDLADPRRIIRL
ncbi:hypothetical protein K435DRAFT_812606 [Dendrothele bispora CBS 962.96]|uniref:Uncharacterized protein n=1 Tax=Dendrothele bispora (strain CBS 962.96) TaxID=1314807 RepID=A0A4S8KNW2_DENBC|nr:hypothetical protein K435DRAFT_812606 [Dendrothele bispora CBS 962.96]